MNCTWWLRLYYSYRSAFEQNEPRRMVPEGTGDKLRIRNVLTLADFTRVPYRHRRLRCRRRWDCAPLAAKQNSGQNACKNWANETLILPAVQK